MSDEPLKAPHRAHGAQEGPSGPPKSSGPPTQHGDASAGGGGQGKGDSAPRRSTKRVKGHSSKYKVRKHGAPAMASAGPWEGHEGDAGHAAEAGTDETAARRHHGRRRPRSQYAVPEPEDAGRKHASKTIIGKLGMTAAGAAGRTALMEQKRKLYKDTTQQPLWGIRKLTINPIDKDDLRRFPGNCVHTTKYTFFSFLPKALWKQFHRLPNWWLVLVLILEYIPLPRFHPLTPWSILLPLVFTLGLCLAKEMLLDLQRRATDRWRNFRVCTIIDGRRPQLRMVHWGALRVGNIVRLTDEEEVPADIVVLATSNPEGIAYVETSKLDGETTLKFKQGAKETRTETYPLAIAGIRGRVVCEKPTSAMDHFSGSLKLDAHPRATSLDLSNFIHRGAHLKNTEWLYGVVVYTGHDTRTLRSAKHPSLKFAHIESEVNSYTIVSFFIVALLILISVMSKSSVQDRERVNNVRTEFPSSISFMLGTTEALQNPWLSIIRYMTLFLAVIPISLPFVLDCAYCVQAWLIQGDSGMTVGAPQQPLGSTYAVGFGLPPLNQRAQEQSHRTGLSGADPAQNNITTSAESLDAAASLDRRTSKATTSREGTSAGTLRNSSNDAARTELDPFIESHSSQTMQSFAQAKGDSTWPSVHTPNIIPDLGQVDFVFIDKTGTLTGNDMTFSMCSVVGRCVNSPFSKVPEPLFRCFRMSCSGGGNSVVCTGADYEAACQQSCAVFAVVCWFCSIYGMTNYGGSIWQQDECRTRSGLVDTAGVEQTRAKRADSTTSSVRRHHSARGLWTSSHVHHGRLHKGSAQDSTSVETSNAAFHQTGTHSRPMRRQVSKRQPSAASSDSQEGTSLSTPLASDSGSPFIFRWESGRLDCIRTLDDNSPRGRWRRGVDRRPGPCRIESCGYATLSDSSSPVPVDEGLRAVAPKPVRKNIAFAVDEIIESGNEEPGREGSRTDSEGSYGQSLPESSVSATRGALTAIGEGIGDDSSEATSKKDDKQRLAFLCDNLTLPSHFRASPPDGQIRRNCDFYDTQIFEDLANGDERSHRVSEFLKCMALCNTVVPHYKGGVGGVETFLPSTLVQSWVTSAGTHTGASVLARSIGTTAVVGQRPNTRASAIALREAGGKISEEKGQASVGGLWPLSSEQAVEPQPLFARGDSASSGQQREATAKLAKKRKSLGRGVSFKDTHEEYSFPKDGDETVIEDGAQSFSTAGISSKPSGEFSSIGRSVLPKLSRVFTSDHAVSGYTRYLLHGDTTARGQAWDAARLLRSIKYQASSPDEECLVSAASHMGYSLASRSPAAVVLQVCMCTRNL
ncbi:guanylyl cyclase [Cyclospora cayetanensis]|uniref:Guanylyl cyclase n=1 Tax=Cyclospora cayetanensis TaxID=88456 RepID=A0A1D3DAK4_9EIME|nr:guanylyl cyclase [Cyclospora cayetanensis]